MPKRDEIPTVSIFCDGSCSPSGTRAYHGGWCAILVFGDMEKVVSGHRNNETNSTMELQALISGLEQLKRPSRVEFYCDAQYVVIGVNEWLDKWIERRWRKVAHPDLWQEIDRYRQIHQIHGNWIRGHAPKRGRTIFQEYNVRCDEIAEQEAWSSYWETIGEKA